MRYTRLADWLRWQETLNPRDIDLGLERVGEVAERLGVRHPDARVITVAGTNGKGSCVTYLEAILAAGGARVGAYLSPHLVRYNERIRIAGREVGDTQLLEAFAAVDAARGEISLTYFEFGTLAALWLFDRENVDFAVLEVGLGGRLDAVNVVDPDVAVVTSVGLDHLDWLGPDRESIGFEKAGIFRAGRPAVCGDPEPPRRLLARADGLGTELRCNGCDYDQTDRGATWDWQGRNHRRESLPYPALGGDYQLQNAGTALAALEAGGWLPAGAVIARGLLRARLPGRLQVLAGLPVPVVLDVAHNPAAARALARALRLQTVTGRTRLVLGMLNDKDVEGVAAALRPVTDDWHVAGLDAPRGLDAEALAARLQAGGVASPTRHASVSEALRAVLDAASGDDRVVVCGSFLTVGAVLSDPLYSVSMQSEG